jgi:hypothetical protein
MFALLSPPAAPKKPVFLQAAICLSWVWTFLSAVIPAVSAEVSAAGHLFLAQFFTLNALLLVHVSRGDRLAYRIWLFLQLAYVAASFEFGVAPSQPGLLREALGWLAAGLSLLICVGMGYPLTYRWFTDVRALRAAASLRERLEEARLQQRMSLAWGAVGPVTLTLGAGLPGPEVALVLGTAIFFAVIGFVMVMVQSRRVFKILRSGP